MIRADVIRAVFTSELSTADAGAYYGISQGYASMIRRGLARPEVTVGLLLCDWLDRAPTKKHKLTTQEADEIRQLFGAGVYNQPELAALYGLTQTGIHHVVNYHSYKPSRALPWATGQKKITPPIRNEQLSRKRRSRIQRRRCRLLDA